MDTAKHRSSAVQEGASRAPHRSLLHALGWDGTSMGRPVIGIANSCSELIPGHRDVRKIADNVREGIWSEGGVACEFGTIGVCDGIAMGQAGMKYSLPSRDLIADSIEIVAQAHALDGLVLVVNCDKIVPGMLMAAARLDLLIDEKEWAKRTAAVRPRVTRTGSAFLDAYVADVGPASGGALRGGTR